MADREINIRVSAQDQTAGVFGSIRKKMRDLLGAEPSGPISAKNIEESLFGGSERGIRGLLKGGAVGFIGDQFEQFTEKGADLAENLRRGDISMRDMGADLIRSVPILGSFVKGWDNVRDAITGEKAEIQNILDSAKAINEAVDLRQVYEDESRKAAEEYLAILTKIRHETALLNAPPSQRPGLAAQFSAEDEKDAINVAAEEEARVNPHKAEYDKVLADLHKAMASPLPPQFLTETIDKGYHGNAIAGSSVTESKQVENPDYRKAVDNRDRLNDKLNDLDKAEKDRKEGITRRANGNLSGIDGRAAAQAEAIRRANQEEIEAQERDHVARLEAIHSEARAKELEAQGKFLDAEKERLQEGFLQSTRGSLVRLGAEIRAHPDNFFPSLSQAGKEIAASFQKEGVDLAAAGRGDSLVAARRQMDVDRQVNEAKLNGLQIEARSGSLAKEMQLEQAEIAEQYRQKREEINQQLREDLALTAQQRDSLNGILAGLDDQEAKEKRIAEAKRLNFRVTSANTGLFVNGTLVSSFDNRTAQIRQNIINGNRDRSEASANTSTMVRQVELQTQMVDMVNRILTAINGSGTSIFN